MAIRDFFFTRRSADSSGEQASSPLPTPTFVESFFGYGKAVKERNIQVKRIYKEYHGQKDDFLREGHKEWKEIEESLADQKEKLFKKSGYKDLADVKRLTKEQLRDHNLKEVVDEFAHTEKKTLQEFRRKQATGIMSLQADRNLKRRAVFQQTHHPDRPTGMAA